MADLYCIRRTGGISSTQTAVALGAAPFVAGTYGFFYGRLNLETTYQRLKLQRLPKAFEGFRIVQLSDFHISPFMPAEQIRKYVAIANELKGDLVALTGDFLLYDPAAQPAIVQALAALKAPFGVFGCLGNHEYMTRTEESIARLFAGEHIRILRQERTSTHFDQMWTRALGAFQQAAENPLIGAKHGRNSRTRSKSTQDDSR